MEEVWWDILASDKGGSSVDPLSKVVSSCLLKYVRRTQPMCINTCTLCCVTTVC